MIGEGSDAQRIQMKVYNHDHLRPLESLRASDEESYSLQWDCGLVCLMIRGCFSHAP